MKDFLNRISFLVSGFVIGNGLLFILIIIDRTFYDSIIYHYSDCLVWYVLFYLLPILIGILVYCLLKDKTVPKRIRIVIWFIAIIEISSLFTGLILNKNYWGYAQKRPSVFKEIKKAEIVTSIANISNIDSTGIRPFYIKKDTTKTLDCLYGRKNSYYGLTDRIFMVFQDRVPRTGQLYDFPEIYNNHQTKPVESVLPILTEQIKKSDLIKKGRFRENNLKQLNGFLTEFITTDSIVYVFACLKGREVSNDHYPYYEFLFSGTTGQNRLLKEQRIYTDVAGIEGIEFATIFPSISFLLSIFGLIIIGLLELIYQLMTRFKR